MINRDNANLVYCLQYLRNGGERIRAIRLAADVLGMGVIEARDYVDGLHTPIPVDAYEAPKVECKSCHTRFDKDDQRLAVGLCPVCAEML